MKIYTKSVKWAIFNQFTQLVLVQSGTGSDPLWQSRALNKANFDLQIFACKHINLPLSFSSQKLWKEAKNPCFGSQWEKAQQRNQDSRENIAGRRRHFSLHHQLYSFKQSTDNEWTYPIFSSQNSSVSFSVVSWVILVLKVFEATV